LAIDAIGPLGWEQARPSDRGLWPSLLKA